MQRKFLSPIAAALHLGTLRHATQRTKRLLLPAFLVCVIVHSLAAAQGEWDHLFTLPGLNKNAPALAVDNEGNVYAGGTFTTAGGRPASGVAVFDGDQWNALGSGIGSSDWFCAYAIAVAPSGTVYVGGIFSQAGGLSVNNIAQWTGANWLGLGDGIDGLVSAMAIDSSGNLFVGGSFTSADGLPTANIAKWDGSTWSSLGSGTNEAVHELAFDSGDNLYATGRFDSAGGVAVNHLARWNGSEWQDVNSPLLFSGEALTVDSFDNVYASDQTTVYKYDGAVWTQQGYSFNNMPDALLVDLGGNLYVGGGFNSAYGDPVDGIARLDGSTWVQLGKGMSWAIALAKDGAGNIYVTNDSPSLEGSNGIRFGYIAKWDGTQFSGVGPGAAGPWPVKDLVVDDSTNLYVAGSFHYAGFVPAKYVARWDGEQWHAFGPGPKGPVNAIALAGSDSVSAAGSYSPGDGSVYYGYVSQWTGSDWTDLAVETDNPSGLSHVSDILLGQEGTVYAVGSFATVDGTEASNVAFWNGSAWLALGQGLNGSAWVVVGDEVGDVYVGGAFTTAGSLPAANIAKWDGSIWSALGPGPGGDVTALTFDSYGTLFASGDFGTAKWDGSSWTNVAAALGKTTAGTVNTLAADDYGRVYAGGQFSSIGGVSANNLAVWSGASWSPLGSGADGSVDAVTVHGGNQVFAAGQFENVGGSESVGVGLWIAEATTIAPIVHVEADAFLQGPYALGSMPVGTAFSAHVPLTQPYSDPSYDGTLLDHDSLDVVPTLPDSVVDWVLVSLRSDVNAESEVAGSQRAAFLLEDGSIVDTMGGPLAFPGIAPTGYYLVVRHRNHTSIMSADTLDLSDGYGTWDFTTAMSQAYSAAGDPMKDLGGGKFGMFACDANADGLVTAPDFNLWNAATSSGAYGYEQADCNMDGVVTALDFNLWNANTSAGAGSKVPD